MADSTRSAPSALELVDLSFSYGGRFALDRVSLHIEAGVFTALLGPNGAGKTTLFSLIAHQFEPRTGTVRVGGWDMRQDSAKALARLGIVFQQPTLDLDLSVIQNLRYAARLHGLGGARARPRIDAELERLDLAARRDQKVRELSGGLRRRVELARALLHEPPLLLLDEPTVGLDVASRGRIVDDVHALAASGMAVLWATHLIDEVRGGDRVVIMREGSIRAEGERDRVVETTCAASLGEAFAALTGPGGATGS